MQPFNYYLTKYPHELSTVFISDLHLSADTPLLTKACVQLLGELAALPNLQALYILGDWLDAWIGDDDYLSLTASERQAHFLTPVIDKLASLSAKGTVVNVMWGNRDFMLGQPLCDVFGGQLIHEPHFFDINPIAHDKTAMPSVYQPAISVRLEHGDALCTDDKSYQRYRAIIRHPITQRLLRLQSLKRRRTLAIRIKQKSAQDKQIKSSTIMDVNNTAVTQVMKNCDILLHGHTHRPAIHELANEGRRIVLGDWRTDGTHVSAVIGVMVHGEIYLSAFSS